MFSFLRADKSSMVAAADALPGRDTPLMITGHHTVLKSSMKAPFPDGSETIVLGLGCFWGAERRLWQHDGVITTSVGYAGGYTKNPTYEEVCGGRTGHTEVVQVTFDPTKTTLAAVLKTFFEAHDPTQGMRQQNDVGTQYRSSIYWTYATQEPVVREVSAAYAAALKASGQDDITTELKSLDDVGGYFFAEEYHQQYLDKNPDGYCGLKGTGIACPVFQG